MNILDQFPKLWDSVQIRKLQLTIKGVVEWADVGPLSRIIAHWHFRGQASSSWGLSSNIERTAKAFGLESKWLRERESWMLRQFQRRAHDYIEHLPAPDSRVDWLALMQQFGAPTRLLDFTHSFYVAAYFALAEATGESALWAINPHLLEELGCEVSGDKSFRGSIYHRNRRHLQIAEAALAGTRVERVVVSVEPERLPHRLAIQQGLFLTPCDLSGSFDDNFMNGIRSFRGRHDIESKEDIVDLSDVLKENGVSIWDYAVVKLLLPSSVQYRALSDLEKMNITSATLFPGLDGFARSLKLEMRLGQIQQDYERDIDRIQSQFTERLADLRRAHGLDPSEAESIVRAQLNGDAQD